MVDLPAGLPVVQRISSLDIVSEVFAIVTIEKPHVNNDDDIKVSLGLRTCPQVLYEYRRPKHDL